MARLLVGAWRSEPPLDPVGAEELAALAPLLFRTGAAGLGWWRVRRAAASAVSETLHQAFRMQALHAIAHEVVLGEAVDRLRAAGVEPVLGKGWAAARLYPDPGLRPYGDIDLFVREEDHARATAALACAPEVAGRVDLHRGFAELSDQASDALLDRSLLLPLNGKSIRVFGEEDHLRLIALHMLRHGAWRPLWLCDVAAAMESRSCAFDWDLVLGGAARRSQWTRSALQLACLTLGARSSDLPAEVTRLKLPRWLVPTVLRQWGTTFEPQGSRTPMAAISRRPRTLWRALRTRWPNAVEASVGVGAPVNELPRLPFQIAEAVRRLARFALELPAFARSGRPGGA
jgi:hypothetical protein